MCCTRLAQIQHAKNTPKIAICALLPNFVRLYLRNCVYWQSEKKFLISNISPTFPHNMANFGSLTAEIGWRVCGTPANFNGFRVLPSLLQRRRSTEVNKTLQDVWPSHGLVHCLYIFGALTPNGILPAAKFTLRPSLAFSYIGSVTARHSNSGSQPNLVAWYWEWNYGTFAIFGWAAITFGIGPHSSSNQF